MKNRHNTASQGFTLLEALVTATILATFAAFTHTLLTDFIPRYQVISSAYDVHNLILKARAGALSDRSQRIICAGDTGCSTFNQTDSLIMGRDDNQNGELETGEVIDSLNFPGNTTLEWKRFNGNSLVFHSSGISHFQNGSFYICNTRAGRKVVMNWIGRTRIETLPTNTCP